MGSREKVAKWLAALDDYAELGTELPQDVHQGLRDYLALIQPGEPVAWRILFRHGGKETWFVTEDPNFVPGGVPGVVKREGLYPAPQPEREPGEPVGCQWFCHECNDGRLEDYWPTHCPTCMAKDLKTEDLYLAPQPERDREALKKLLQWIRTHKFTIQGDWACKECRPNSDILTEGFLCALHNAEKILGGEDG